MKKTKSKKIKRVKNNKTKLKREELFSEKMLIKLFKNWKKK